MQTEAKAPAAVGAATGGNESLNDLVLSSGYLYNTTEKRHCQELLERIVGDSRYITEGTTEPGTGYYAGRIDCTARELARALGVEI